MKAFVNCVKAIEWLSVLPISLIMAFILIFIGLTVSLPGVVMLLFGIISFVFLYSEWQGFGLSSNPEAGGSLIIPIAWIVSTLVEIFIFHVKVL